MASKRRYSVEIFQHADMVQAEDVEKHLNDMDSLGYELSMIINVPQANKMAIVMEREEEDN